jgi:hypothetical protein
MVRRTGIEQDGTGPGLLLAGLLITAGSVIAASAASRSS